MFTQVGRLLQEAGFRVKWVDVRRPDILEQLKGCHGFMWRGANFRGMYRIARRLLPVLERECGLQMYPDQNTCWHYDDKIEQAYLFDALDIPAPRSWVWYDQWSAMSWAREADYPMVFKLPGGSGSVNVKMLHAAAEAMQCIERLFDRGVYDLRVDDANRWSWGIQRFRSAAKLVITGIPPQPPLPPNAEYFRGQVLFQEFLPGNDYDTRVTVIGNRAFGFRRYNRENDFRASGSGRIDYTPAGIDEKFIRLAFYTARKLRSQSCAVDGLWDQSRAVICEVSYTYISRAVHACPGHWELHGEPEEGKLKWVEGKMWPEEAQIEDFIGLLGV